MLIIINQDTGYKRKLSWANRHLLSLARVITTSCTERREEVSPCFIITEHARFCKPKYILCPNSLTAEYVSQAPSVEQMLTRDVIIWMQGTYRHRAAEPKKIRVKRTLRTRQDQGK